MRYELKYMLTPIQYEILRGRLKWVMEPDEHVGDTGEYFIRSVYFDSPDRVAFQEKISGVNKRKKYRIRFYNGDSTRCNLECKDKNGTRITKYSQALDAEWTRKLLRGECDVGTIAQSIAEKNDLLGELLVLIADRGFAPAVTVDYVREPYVLPLSDLRITFDKEIAWGGVEESMTHERFLSCVYGDNIVLEVKYNEYLPQHISSILASVAPVQTAASKYAACVEAKYNAVGY